MEYRGCLISLMSLLEVTFFIKLTGRTTTLRLQVQSSCRVFAFAEWMGVAHGMDIAFVLGAPFKGLSEPQLCKRPIDKVF